MAHVHDSQWPRTDLEAMPHVVDGHRLENHGEALVHVHDRRCLAPTVLKAMPHVAAGHGLENGSGGAGAGPESAATSRAQAPSTSAVRGGRGVFSSW